MQPAETTTTAPAVPEEAPVDEEAATLTGALNDRDTGAFAKSCRRK
jgi:hypothetical protein